MTTALRPLSIHETLFSQKLIALAPSLVLYNGEPGELIAAIESDALCTRTFLHYANKRSQDLQRSFGEVRQAVIFLGMIDVKHFLFAYLLLRRDARLRHRDQRLLLRAKLCAQLFQTNGPVNKDLAFITAMLTGYKYLNCDHVSCVFDLFGLDSQRQQAITHLQYDLRDAVHQAVALSSNKTVSNDDTLALNEEDKERYQEAVYWANTVVGSLCCPV